MSKNKELRLDAGESFWLKREIEYVDDQIYEEVYEENVAREIIPSQTNIPEWASVYIWSQMATWGKAKIVSNMADDIPRVDVTRTEEAKTIKVVADAYGWSIFDIKRAIAQGIHLDTEKAGGARRAMETELDRILARGDAPNNLQGILNLDTVAANAITPVVAVTKTGGGTAWSAAATSQEIANDFFKLLETTITKLKGAQNTPMFNKFRIVVPDSNYLRLLRKMSDQDQRSILAYLMENPYIESIRGWHHCHAAGANGTDDRIAIFPPRREVVAGIVPMEFTPQEVEKRNLEYVVDCVATCGGVVTRYPMAVGYMDAIQTA